jgi:hypothetical protein
MFAGSRGWPPSIGARPCEASTHPRAAWDAHHSTRSGFRRTARHEPRPAAGATQKWTLEAIDSGALLGAGSAPDFRCRSLAYDGLLAGAQCLSGGHTRPLGWVVFQLDRSAISVA